MITLRERIEVCSGSIAQKSSLWQIPCPACLCLKDIDSPQMRLIFVAGDPQARQERGDFVVDVHCDSLRAWILPEECDVVQVCVVEGGAHLAQRFFKVAEVKQHSARVKGSSLHVRVDFVVVAVQILALPVIIAQKMRRREIGAHTNLKHTGIIAESLRGVNRILRPQNPQHDCGGSGRDERESAAELEPFREAHRIAFFLDDAHRHHVRARPERREIPAEARAD